MKYKKLKLDQDMNDSGFKTDEGSDLINRK